MSSTKRINERAIRVQWNRHNLAGKLEPFFGKGVSLDESAMKCYKDSFKSSIWRLKLGGKSREEGRKQDQSYLILKIFKSISDKRAESLIELNIYRKGQKVLSGFMPKIYFIKPDILGNDVWVLMEHVEAVESQVTYSPLHFDKIIPTLTKLHASTFHYRSNRHFPAFADWLPVYSSEASIKERNIINGKTLLYLDAAMNRSDLHALLSPHYKSFQAIIRKGPNYFPELVEAGECIVHSDLQALNIGCNNVHDAEWRVKFIDWEGARLDPCWFDVVSLVGVFLSYRDDWRKQERSIINHCSQLYAKEMQKQGIVFRINPVKLYKMAVLQLILETNLYHQLMWEMEGIKRGVLLPGYIEKINVWGKELGLY